MKIAIFYHSCYCTMTAKNPAMCNNASTNVSFTLTTSTLSLSLSSRWNVIRKISLMGTQIVPKSCRCILSWILISSNELTQWTKMFQKLIYRSKFEFWYSHTGETNFSPKCFVCSIRQINLYKTLFQISEYENTQAHMSCWNRHQRMVRYACRQAAKQTDIKTVTEIAC